MKRQIPIKSISKWIILIFITTFCVSCKKDGTTSENSKTSKYSELQRWYNTENAKSLGGNNTLPGLIPNWEKVNARQDSTKIIYEVEVENPNKVFLANEKIDASKASESYKLSQFRLVFIIDQKTKEIKGGFMNILSENINETDKEIHYKNVGTFSGKIQYYSISGKYLNGWAYKNGKINKTIKPGQFTINNGVKTEYDLCSTTKTPRYGTICAGEGDGGGCTTSFLGWDTATSCQSFNPDDGSAGGGDFGGGGGDPAPNPSLTPLDNNDFVNKIDDEKLKDCFKKALEKLKYIDRACLPNLVTAFAGTTPGYNWKMQDGITNGNNAVTSNIYNSSTGTVTTTFNSANFKGGSDLAIAKTILHESVHAYLVAYFKVDPLSAQKTFSQYLQDFNSTTRPDLNDLQHNEMVRNFIGSVAGNLITYGKNQGYNLPDQFYYDLSWGGLQETSAFKAFSEEVQKRINNVILSEQSGKDIDGNTSSPKGSTSGGC
ncbi:hypothetical protein [Pedobacter sp. WC2423]|uniref:hypothetical protein n=1 Tax=Pedobacter sp. WC2423 TaxID=3234142 RepID=UPI0034668AC7